MSIKVLLTRHNSISERMTLDYFDQPYTMTEGLLVALSVPDLFALTKDQPPKPDAADVWIFDSMAT